MLRTAAASLVHAGQRTAMARFATRGAVTRIAARTAPLSVDLRWRSFTSNPEAAGASPEVSGEQELNPYLLKYREKIAKRLSENNGQLEAKDPDKEIRQYFNVPDTDESDEKVLDGWKKLYDDVQARLGTPPQVDGEQRVFNARRLSEIVNLEKIRALASHDIEHMWGAHFGSKARMLSASMSAQAYSDLAHRAADSPLFVYALPREGGSELFLSQYSSHQMFFTSLLEYQTHGENAPVLLTLTNYVDLIKEKGLVLCLAEFDDKRLSVGDAQTLLDKMREHLMDEEKYQVVRRFNHEPAKFDINEIIAP